MREDVSLRDEDGCICTVRISSHEPKDHNRGEFGGTSYNLYSQIGEDKIIIELGNLMARTHEKKTVKIKPKSRWIKPEQALKEYNITELPEGLVWYKKNSPLRRSILRESLENALKNNKITKEM